MEGEGGRLRELHKIVLSTRSRQQLDLDQKVRLAHNWEQVAEPLLILMWGLVQVLEQVRELVSGFGVETFWNLGGSGVYAAQLAHTNTLQGSR